MQSLNLNNELRILLVESCPDRIAELTASFSELGVHIDTASDAETALRMIETSSYEAALINLLLPRTSGLQLARRIRACREQVACVLMSAFPVPVMQLAKCDSGIVGVIPLPSAPEDVVLFVKKKVALQKTSTTSHCDCSCQPTPFDLPLYRFA